MNARTKQAVIDAAIERRMGITRQKGAEYSGAGAAFENDNVDTLANFRRNGEKLGLHPVLILALYLNKHVDSYETFMRQFGELSGIVAPDLRVGELRKLVSQGEGIISRLDDIRNYVDLLECLLIDEGIVDGSYQDFMPVVLPNVRQVGKNVVAEDKPALDMLAPFDGPVDGGW